MECLLEVSDKRRALAIANPKSTLAHRSYCTGENDGIIYVIVTLANVFEQDNPNFDRERFFAASGM